MFGCWRAKRLSAGSTLVIAVATAPTRRGPSALTIPIAASAALYAFPAVYIAHRRSIATLSLGWGTGWRAVAVGCMASSLKRNNSSKFVFREAKLFGLILKDSRKASGI